jgi:hypothetical protein
MDRKTAQRIRLYKTTIELKKQQLAQLEKEFQQRQTQLETGDEAFDSVSNGFSRKMKRLRNEIRKLQQVVESLEGKVV